MSAISAISTVAQAVSATNTVTKAVTPTAQQTAVPAAKNGYTHWSVYVVGAGAIVALITGIALAVLLNFPLAAVFGVLTGIQVLGTYYLKVFGPYKALADIANQFTNIIKGTTQNQKEIQQASQSIQQSNVQISQTIQQTSKVIAQGDTAIQDSAKLLKDFQDKEAENTKALNATIDNLKLQLKASDDKLAAEKLQASALQKQVDDLNKSIQELDEVQSKISKDTKALETAAQPDPAVQKRTHENKQKAKDLMTQLKAQALSTSQILQQDAQELDSDVAALNTDADKIAAGAKQMSDAASSLATTQQKLSTSIEAESATNKNLALIISQLKKIKAGAQPTPTPTAAS